MVNRRHRRLNGAVSDYLSSITSTDGDQKSLALISHTFDNNSLIAIGGIVAGGIVLNAVIQKLI